MDLWQPLKLSLLLAAVSTALLLLISVPSAYLLAKSRSRLRLPIEAALSLPIVLPPTVLGFYLLLIFSEDGILGHLSTTFFGAPLAFHFSGLVVGSIIYSLPFVMQPILSCFKDLGDTPFKVAATLGMGPLRQFFSVALPLAKTSILTGAVLGFAHTLGEFGVVLMIGGNIKGETRVLSIAIYNHVEALEYDKAHTLSLILVAISFAILLLVTFLNSKKSKENKRSYP